MATVASAAECPLRRLGYAVLPSPRHAEVIEGTWVRLGRAWQVSLESGVDHKDIAVRTLRNALAGLPETLGAGTIRLRVAGGSVETGVADGRDRDAYLLQVSPAAITLSANGAPGLFYGVQTLLQLAAGRPGAAPGELPAGRIEDWPEHEIRALHWDTKHHLDRPETLRRFLDQAAQFKVNTIVYEIEDKFAYPSHPVVGAPGAWTAAELQGFVNDALERHIQIIPDLQAPAHVGFILKHEEFAHLRCDGNRYQICMDDPAARRLIFDLYDDLCAATAGCKYFLVSTDEVYYAGICGKYRSPYNEENRSLTLVDFVKAAHAHLAQKGRRTIMWVEYPVLPEHVSLLPADLIDGVGPAAAELQAAVSQHGLAQFAYTSMQGEELLVPNNFPWADREGKAQPGRLQQACEALRRAHHVIPHCMGIIGAAWDDSGLHNETFWLGWAVVAQGGWHPAPHVEETISSFLRIHHGNVASEMDAIYRGLDAGARFYERTLERLPSTVRTTPGYGNSRGKRAVNRSDWGMVAPALPAPGSPEVTPVFRPRYAAVLAEVPAQLQANQRLLAQLDACLKRADRNRHALEVFRSIALLQRRHLEIMVAAAAAEDLLVAAPAAGAAAAGRQAVALVRQALADLEQTYQELCRTWEIGRFPKGQTVGGRKFLHVMDDVKDHIGDRTPDLGYLIAPDLRIGLAEWTRKIESLL